MFAAREQENLVHNHQQLAASKPLNASIRNTAPKTPGNQYPKTPLKIPIRDENAPTALRTAKGKNGTTQGQFVTPMGAKTATRAPLGAKTTNAKAKAVQTPALNKDEKIQTKPTSNRRPKHRVSHADTIRIEVHGDVDADAHSNIEDREPEYCPPSVPYPPYESDDFPDGCIDYTPITGDNLMRGFQRYFQHPLDDNGESIALKRQEAEHQKALDESEARIRAAVNNTDWSLPEEITASKDSSVKQGPSQKRIVTTNRQLLTTRPGTAISRKAAATLGHINPTSISTVKSFASKPPTIAKGPMLITKTRAKPLYTSTSSTNPVSATMRSRSTIGYTKGRTASNLIHSSKSVLKAPSASTANDTAQPKVSSMVATPVSNFVPVAAKSQSTTHVKEQHEEDADKVEHPQGHRRFSIYDLALGDGQAGFGDDQDLSTGIENMSINDVGVTKDTMGVEDVDGADLDVRVSRPWSLFEDEDKDYVFTLDGH